MKPSCDAGRRRVRARAPQGVVPALVMVSNPVVQFFLYEWLTARLLDVRRKKLQQLRQQHAK